MIRVLLADDQALVRGALAAMLGLETDIEVVAQVSAGDEVVAAARETKPDVALVDVQMPGKDGITAAAELHRELPSCRIVVCTTFGRPGYLSRAMAAGAVGFVVKDAPPEQLVDAIRRVHAGLRVVDPALAAESLATGHSPLTERERDVLRVVVDGGTIADVARVLCLSQGRFGTICRRLSGRRGRGHVLRRLGSLRNVGGCEWSMDVVGVGLAGGEDIQFFRWGMARSTAILIEAMLWFQVRVVGCRPQPGRLCRLWHPLCVEWLPTAKPGRWPSCGDIWRVCV